MLPNKVRQHTAMDGASKAISASSGLLSRDVEHDLELYHKLNNDDARAAFIDRWLCRMSSAMRDHWPMFYKCGLIAKEKEIFKDTNKLRGHGLPPEKAFDTFEEYWTARTGDAFGKWAELESLHHFAATVRPDLFGRSFEEARRAQVAAIAAEEKHGGKPGNTSAEKKAKEDSCESKNEATDDSTVFDDAEKQRKHGGNNDYLLGRLKRDAANDAEPERQAAAKQALDNYVAGKHASVRGAAVAAGIIKPERPETRAAKAVNKSADLAILADKLLDKVPRDRLVELMALIFERLPMEDRPKLAGWLKLMEGT